MPRPHQLPCRAAVKQGQWREGREVGHLHLNPFSPNPILLGVWSKGREDSANICLLMNPRWDPSCHLSLNAVFRKQAGRERAPLKSPTRQPTSSLEIFKDRIHEKSS